MNGYSMVAVLLGALASMTANAAQDPLAARTLIVYSTNSPDSVAVKDHYINARFDVPSTAKLCPITLPDVTATALVESDYINSVKTPIRDCLNAAGKTNILYIVLAYIRPYVINLSRGRNSYSMDSYLADIWDQYSTTDFNPAPSATHRYYADVQSMGQVYPPFQSLATYRASPRSHLLYSVWRLDGATPAIANGLVDKATSAMNNVTGAACIDPRYDPTGVQDSGYTAGEWDLHRAAQILAQAAFSVTEDLTSDEFGSGTAPAKCPSNGGPVALYSGWYSFNNYNGAGVFNWAPGAIGVHLDSASAIDPRGGSNWVANALLNGITVTDGVIAEPYLEGLTRPAGLFRNLLEGANVGDAFLRNTRWLKWMIMNVGDPLYRPFPSTGRAPFNPPAPADSLAITVRELVGGLSTTGRVNLATTAPAGGTTVTLTSSTPTVAATPASITVAAGARSANFPITTSTQTNYSNALISASTGASVVSNSILVMPLIGAVILSQGTVSAGQTISGTVFLNGRAPSGGITVSLQSSDTTVATVPVSVPISAGLDYGNFSIHTFVVTTNKTATITASYAGSAVQATLTAVPAIASITLGAATVNSGTNDNFELYLSVPAPAGGATVTIGSTNPAATQLLPASVFLPAGTRYANVQFIAGTGPATSTISVSYGGDTKSALLTIN